MNLQGLGEVSSIDASVLSSCLIIFNALGMHHFLEFYRGKQFASFTYIV